MNIKIKSYSSQSSIISSIIFFILGAVLFTSADKVITTLSKFIGVIFAIMAIGSFIVLFFQIRKNNVQKGNVLFGLISTALAIIFIFFSGLIEKVIRYFIGAWIVYTGIMRLIDALFMKKNNPKHISLLIVSLLLIAVGIYTILFGDVIITSLGVIMMIYAVIEAVGFILYSKDSKESDEPGSTTLIIPENTDDKVETIKEEVNIKDVKEKKKKEKKEKKTKRIKEK